MDFNNDYFSIVEKKNMVMLRIDDPPWGVYYFRTPEQVEEFIEEVKEASKKVFEEKTPSCLGCKYCVNTFSDEDLEVYNICNNIKAKNYNNKVYRTNTCELAKWRLI